VSSDGNDGDKTPPAVSSQHVFNALSSAGGSTNATEPPPASGAGNAGDAPLEGGRHLAAKKQPPRRGGTEDDTRHPPGSGRVHTAAVQTPESGGISDGAQPGPVECWLHALHSLFAAGGNDAAANSKTPLSAGGTGNECDKPRLAAAATPIFSCCRQAAALMPP